jgi:hypothetical protein
MTDGYQVYRAYRKRLRCGAHLPRKARGLVDSRDRKAQSFGKEVWKVLTVLRKAVDEARESLGRDWVMDCRARGEGWRLTRVGFSFMALKHLERVWKLSNLLIFNRGVNSRIILSY